MPDPVQEFIVAACVPLDSSHASGTLDLAEAILRQNPQISRASIYTAAILGDAQTVQRLLAEGPGTAIAKGGPHNWDALTYLCFSRYLRLDRERSDGFVRSARALLEAGASPNSGFFSPDHKPEPSFESVLYGAAGVAHHAGVTRVLLEHGADPNDGEVTYHSPEDTDNSAMKLLVQTGKLTQDSLATMLARKADWHDFDGIQFLLEHGANPNHMTRWGISALHQAIRRDNHLQNIEAMLDHGADPLLMSRADAKSSVSMAARRGRADALELFERRGTPIRLAGVERLIAACARNDSATIQSIVQHEPELVDELKADGGKLLAEFAGNGNTHGIRQLLDLGVAPDALYAEGDGYFDIARNSTALHVAAWRAQHSTVKLLLERGAPVAVLDGKGRTALALAVRACVDSYWTARRSPESVEALLRAGASVAGINYPSGYGAIDDLLKAHGAVGT